MAPPGQRLYKKLCRELAQSEHDARLHTRREARRLGDVPPARALLEIARHADEVNETFERIAAAQIPIGLRIGRAVGEVFSAVRHFTIDRLIDTERSFRMTLLGLKHGVDVARLLRVVAAEMGDVRTALLCDELVRERGAQIELAERTLIWFASHPRLALARGGT